MSIKLDLTKQKVNLIFSAVCLALAAIIAIICGVQFVSFKNYQTEFVLRENVVDEVIKFREYSKYLEGTSADSDFYVINGTENTVALVKADKAAQYANSVPATAKVCAVMGNDAQIEAAKKTLNREDFTSVQDTATAVAGVKAGTYDVAIMRHEDAKKAKKSDNSLAIAKATIEKVPSLLVLGGTHPNEPAGQLTATVLLENAKVERGILYVVTELNKSAYSHSMPQEATPWYYSFEVGSTKRVFKYGARVSNTADQWPSPDVYAHSSGQKLSSSEVRNINRAYPGSETGTFTERIAWAVTNFVLKNDVTMVIDLHEASPEYAVINAMVYHQDSSALAGSAKLKLEVVGVDISSEASAANLHGLTHRELGDFTGAYVFLFETSNASQGKFHGKTGEELVLYENYTDAMYEEAKKHEGVLYAPAVPIRERVARHSASVNAIIGAFNNKKYSRSEFSMTALKETPESVYLGEFKVSGIPSYDNMLEKGVQGYLLPSERKA